MLFGVSLLQKTATGLVIRNGALHESSRCDLLDAEKSSFGYRWEQ